MASPDVKERLLSDGGYTYNFDRMVYVNPGARKVFSVEKVDDTSVDELRRLMQEPTQPGNWTFYFNSEPAPGVQRELEQVLSR